jgi:hypothetical protein
VNDIPARQLNPDIKVNLLSLYATQFGSYTTLLWQVPALSLTAQSFLLTIAVGSESSKYARLIASGLSIIIALSSYALMHDQRGHAINYGALSRRLSKQLGLVQILEGELNLDDAVPRITNAELVWEDKASRARDTGIFKILQPFKPISKAFRKLLSIRSSAMYIVWRFCILLFLLTDLLVVYSALRSYNWFVIPSTPHK